MAGAAHANGRKSIFITGAASGIGLASAKRFAAQGWFVGLSDIDAPGLERALAVIGPENGLSLSLDVRERAQWAQALQAFGAATRGRLDVLLNNAGIGRYGWFEEVAPDEADLIIDVNVKGVMNGAYAALPLLKATPGARLINVASCAGLAGAPRLAAYAASKFAVRGLSEALDAEFSRFGVRVACIMPWFIDTPILNMGAQGSNVNMKDVIAASGAEVYPVEDAAEAIWRAAHGTDLIYTVGKAAQRLRFAARFMPNQLRRQLRRQAQAQAS